MKDLNTLTVGHLDSVTFTKLANSDSHPTAPIIEIEYKRADPFHAPRLTRQDVQELLDFLGGTWPF